MSVGRHLVELNFGRFYEPYQGPANDKTFFCHKCENQGSKEMRCLTRNEWFFGWCVISIENEKYSGNEKERERERLERKIGQLQIK
jgi:hypothetical protein